MTHFLNAQRHWMNPVATFKDVLKAQAVPMEEDLGVLLYEPSDYCAGIFHYALADNGRWVTTCIIMTGNPDVDGSRHTPTLTYKFGE